MIIVMQVDYIIVGLGLAGLAFTSELKTHKKSFVVFENESQHASKVASGVYNPIVLKRFTPVWNAQKQLEIVIPFYEKLEQQLKQKFHYQFSIYRLLQSVEEQNNWLVASDKPVNCDYMVPEIIHKTYTGIKSPFGFGKLHKTGRIDTQLLLEKYCHSLKSKKKLFNEKFNYTAIEFNENFIFYKGIKTKKIVFCEGFGLKDNPYFNELPMQESKGELLTIYAPKLNIDFLLKSSVFVLPLGNNHYEIGATFNWKDKTSTPTKEGKKTLLEKLNTFLKTEYTVVSQHAGIRPTVKDRRPLVGIHNKHSQLAILNGLGTRGVMLAPQLAKELFAHIENNEVLSPEININRFYKMN